MLIKKNKIPILEMVLIGFLPSFLKIILYRIKGYQIGKKVRIGIGSIIIGKDVVIGDYTKIGFITVIRAPKIRIGRYVTIGTMTMIDTENVFIDEDARINENVIIGGQKTPDSFFSLGKRAIIMEYSFINPTKPVIIGDDSGIGGHCLLFTHGSWLNQLDGFPVTFAPINIGNRVWLPWRVFIMPGITIGDDVVIGANSLISSNLPSNVLAAGSPAKIIRENYPTKISDDHRMNIIENILKEFEAYLKHNNLQTESIRTKSGMELRVSVKGKLFYMLYVNSISQQIESSKSYDVLVTDKMDEMGIHAKMRLNLKNKTRKGKSDFGEELAKYFSRHGIRFNRLD